MSDSPPPSPDPLEKHGSDPSQPMTGSADPATASTYGVWERIKQHKVVQWTLAYLALAYTLLHGAEMVGSSLGWSHGLLRTFTLLLILGVPVVIVVSWYHGARGLRRVSGTELMIIAILLAIGGTLLWRDSKTEHAAEGAATPAGGHAAARTGQNSPAAAPPAGSIAVLAFSDLSAEGNQAYFADGIAEEILNVLAHVKGLKVASRTSSFQFRKSELGAAAIAQRLGVRHILEGSVRKAGNTVRISAQLIDASTDQHEWSQTFDRPLSTASLFAIQDEIAKTIVDHLAQTMGSATEVTGPKARKADTADEDAYDLYLKGRSLYIARTKPNLIQAASDLKAAVAKDPKFARAWEMLGAVLSLAPYWDAGDATDYQAGVDAINMALRLDPNLSLAYTVRGQIQVDAVLGQGAVGGWADSFASFARAIEHDATDATVYIYRGANYAALGYFDRAISDYQRCLEIDPVYEICRRHLAEAYLYLGRTDDALAVVETSLGNGYLFPDVMFATAVAARGDRLGALEILARTYQDHPQLIRPLFRALTDRAFSDRDRQDTVALIKGAKNNLWSLSSALLIVKAYGEISSSNMDPPIWWDRDGAWLRSQSRKRLMQSWHLPEYWRKHGFPPQCRPVGNSDFECR